MTKALTHAHYETPVGELSVFADEHGVVRSAGFGPGAQVAAQSPSRLLAEGWSEGPLPHVREAVAAWLGGDGDALATVQVSQEGGPFFRQVWEAALLAFEAGWSAASVLRAGREAHPDQLAPAVALGPAAVVRPAASVVQTASVEQPGGRHVVGGR